MASDRPDFVYGWGDRKHIPSGESKPDDFIGTRHQLWRALCSPHGWYQPIELARSRLTTRRLVLMPVCQHCRRRAGENTPQRQTWPHYFSTYCIHDLHNQCRLTCKHCEKTCRCECHEKGTSP